MQLYTTALIAPWSGEKQGIHGSSEDVHKHFGNPNDLDVGKKATYDKFSAYFNQDYGPGQLRGISLQENEHVRGILGSGQCRLRTLG